jgi:hypothetical protein
MLTPTKYVLTYKLYVYRCVNPPPPLSHTQTVLDHRGHVKNFQNFNHSGATGVSGVSTLPISSTGLKGCLYPDPVAHRDITHASTSSIENQRGHRTGLLFTYSTSYHLKSSKLLHQHSPHNTVYSNLKLKKIFFLF